MGSAGQYSVSNEGRIRNNRTGHLLKTQKPKGRRQEQVWLAGRLSRSYTVAELVGKAFVGGRRFVHLDGDPYNNRAENLMSKEAYEREWMKNA